MTSWEKFFNEKCIEVFSSSKRVIDIGGSLRLDLGKGNISATDNAWLLPYVQKVTYQIMDPVPDYSPDIVGDIHKMPFPDNSLEAIICLAVLEHVENPILAMQEMYRTLQPGGRLLVYVPFLYYYHAERGYYGDYWRFTIDTVKMLAKPFSSYECVPVRLPVETLVKLSPLGRYRFGISIARYLDSLLYKKGSNQVGGYYVYLIK